jgi:cobalt/nickel transport system ATP-binding protein
MNFQFNDSELIFEVNDISYSYSDQILALEHIDLVVHPYEILAIVGSNGSGKSTLLKILDGLYFPSAGSVKAFGQSITEKTLRDDKFNYEFRKRVGFIFQDSDAQLFMPTVWDEIAFGPLQLGSDQFAVKSQVDNALVALHIDKLKNRSPHQLSGGEKKLVALASVMSLSPEVWMLDEPSAGLDPRSVSWLKDFITNHVKEKKTIIISTHDLSLVDAIANRIYVIGENHQIITEGTPEYILSNQPLLKEANLI